MPWYLGNSSAMSDALRVAGISLLALWSVSWTGLALWHAARRDQRGWFIFFLLVHTAGIGEFLYIRFGAGTTNASKRTRRKR